MTTRVALPELLGALAKLRNSSVRSSQSNVTIGVSSTIHSYGYSFSFPDLLSGLITLSVLAEPIALQDPSFLAHDLIAYRLTSKQRSSSHRSGAFSN